MLAGADASPASASIRVAMRLASGLLREAQTLYAPSSASTTARKATTAKSTKDRSMAAPSDFAPHRLEQGLRQIDAACYQAIPAARPHAGCGEVALHRASGADTGLLENEDFLQRHGLAFHAGDLLNAR